MARGPLARLAPRPRLGRGDSEPGGEAQSSAKREIREEGVRHTMGQGERQADGGSGDEEEPGEQHGGRSGLGARQELSATGAQDAPT